MNNLTYCTACRLGSVQQVMQELDENVQRIAAAHAHDAHAEAEFDKRLEEAKKSTAVRVCFIAMLVCQVCRKEAVARCCRFAVLCKRSEASAWPALQPCGRALWEFMFVRHCMCAADVRAAGQEGAALVACWLLLPAASRSIRGH